MRPPPQRRRATPARGTRRGSVPAGPDADAWPAAAWPARAEPRLDPRPRALLGVVDLGDGELERLEQPDELVPEELPLIHELVRHALDGVLVRRHEVVRGDVRLAEDLGRGAALVPVGEDARDRIHGHRPAPGRAIHDLQADLLEAAHDPGARLLLAL